MHARASAMYILNCAKDIRTQYNLPTHNGLVADDELDLRPCDGLRELAELVREGQLQTLQRLPLGVRQPRRRRVDVAQLKKNADRFIVSRSKLQPLMWTKVDAFD